MKRVHLTNAAILQCLLATVLIVAITIVSCMGGIVANAKNAKVGTFRAPNNDAVTEWVDPEYGVHYLILQTKSGNAGRGGICPRYLPDGTIMGTNPVCRCPCCCN